MSDERRALNATHDMPWGYDVYRTTEWGLVIDRADGSKEASPHTRGAPWAWASLPGLRPDWNWAGVVSVVAEGEWFVRSSLTRHPPSATPIR